MTTNRMENSLDAPIEEARQAALRVLLHNAHGPRAGMPRTSGWGYPEPYTRDWFLSTFGILVSGNAELIATLRRLLETAARYQAPRGGIPGLVDDPTDQGSSDTTPLFLISAALYRQVTGESDFLAEAVDRALTWMSYQIPDDSGLVAQQPTSDWRDEQWVLGYGLYVNSLVYTYLRLFERHAEAQTLRELMNRVNVRRHENFQLDHEGLALSSKPYYALWVYKAIGSERFDLMGNSLAILAGIASPAKARLIVDWVEDQCRILRHQGQLATELPPCLIPWTEPGDNDWYPRHALYNHPGNYGNGGVWPYLGGFYVAALVAAGEMDLARQKLDALTRLIKPARSAQVDYGFNEWFKAQDGTPRGEDWQTWSAALYLYAAAAVEQGRTPFFDQIRAAGAHPADHEM
jgi:hypothetical protein